MGNTMSVLTRIQANDPLPVINVGLQPQRQETRFSRVLWVDLHSPRADRQRERGSGLNHGNEARAASHVYSHGLNRSSCRAGRAGRRPASERPAARPAAQADACRARNACVASMAITTVAPASRPTWPQTSAAVVVPSRAPRPTRTAHSNGLTRATTPTHPGESSVSMITELRNINGRG